MKHRLITLLYSEHETPDVKYSACDYEEYTKRCDAWKKRMMDLSEEICESPEVSNIIKTIDHINSLSISYTYSSIP